MGDVDTAGKQKSKPRSLAATQATVLSSNYLKTGTLNAVVKVFDSMGWSSILAALMHHTWGNQGMGGG